jgi:hypothetical protein
MQKTGGERFSLGLPSSATVEASLEIAGEEVAAGCSAAMIAIQTDAADGYLSDAFWTDFG